MRAATCSATISPCPSTPSIPPSPPGSPRASPRRPRRRSRRGRRSARGRHTLVAAPTGSGKTLTAFLAAIDELVRAGPARPSGLRRRDRGGLRLAAEGAVERHPPQPRGAAGRHPRRAGARMGLPDVEIRTAVRTGDTPQAERAQTAAQAAAHPGDDAGVAVRAARLGVRPRDAGDGAHGDRRRDPRGRRQQARQPPGAVAGAAGGAVRAAADADRPVGDAEADRRGRALPGRRRRGRRRRAPTARSSTSATQRARPRARAAADAARAR